VNVSQTLLVLASAAIFSSCGKPESSAESASEKKDGMLKIAGGETTMGSVGDFDTPYGTKYFPEESPIRKIQVTGFWMDETEVTNDQFAAFVKATGYVTYAEREAKMEDFPEEARSFLPEAPFNQGSIVFNPPAEFKGSLDDPSSALSWWRWDPSANWRHPLGESSDISEKGAHPVVCVNFEDASAYAKWAGKRLPTEAEWEFAARGGLVGKTYVWGDELKPGDKWMANTFHGEFPTHDSGEDGFIGSAPVKSYAPNGYGLYDMAGNAWEICSDFYDPEYPSKCESCDPKGPETWINRSSGRKGQGAAHHVTKGGSFLCHISYCMRYRPAARHSMEEDSPASHTGFRCVKDL
jgi:sulfatase modifying factor 1